MASTISISKETKEKLKNLGRTGDSYEDVIKKMYEITKSQILLNYLYDETDCITIDEARRRLKVANSINK
jgi:predicted CopG family antitoxin